MTVAGLSNNPGQGSFTHTRRSPQNHGMGLLFLDGFTNGFAWAQQVLLTNKPIHRVRTHPRRQGLVDFGRIFRK